MLSEAEYLEIALTRQCDPERVRADLDAALPDGLDIIDVVPASGSSLNDLLEASEWEVAFPGVDVDDVADAVRMVRAADTAPAPCSARPNAIPPS